MNKVYLYIILIIGVIYLLIIIKKEDKVVLKDYMEPVEEKTDKEEKPVNSDYEKAWTEENVSKNSKYYKSDIKDEKTDPGKFFNKNNEYVDITEEYKSKDMIPEKCFYDGNELKCQFNNKLQIIPPRLIEDPENRTVILSIGDDKNINTNKLSDEVYSFNGNTYNVWDYGKKNSKRLQYRFITSNGS